uniref:BHLH domain-containing protein n=1 Tax=Leersia perrieri TaxID=77586 RepID=A0A0D9V6C7_9ORYZ
MNDDDANHPFDFVHDDELLVSLGFLLPPPLPPDHRGSAFSAYQCAASSSESTLSQRYRSAPANVHRRMHGYLRSIDVDVATVEMQPAAGEHAFEQQAAPSGGGSARFRHIMRERLRRERLSQGYSDLQAILPTSASTKGGKNIIVSAAASYIRELEGRKGWLRERNEELKRAPAPPMKPAGAGMVVKVRAESEFGSMVDVFEVVLRRLKAMEELQVTAIQSCFCAGGMWMDVAVESKVQRTRVLRM